MRHFIGFRLSLIGLFAPIDTGFMMLMSLNYISATFLLTGFDFESYLEAHQIQPFIWELPVGQEVHPGIESIDY